MKSKRATPVAGHNFRVKIVKDGQIPAFGAWVCKSLKAKDGTILLNVDAMFGELVYGDGSRATISNKERKMHLVEVLMHEFGHALEEHFGLPHSERRIHAAVGKYRK